MLRQFWQVRWSRERLVRSWYVRLMIALWLGVATVVVVTPAVHAAGMVTDCTNMGPGPGTLMTALENGGIVTFACSGTILVTNEIGINYSTIIDGTGQQVVLQGDGDNRIFTVGFDPRAIISFEIRHLTLTGGNAGSEGGGAISTYGGSTFNYTAVTITHSSLLSNTAFYGGAIDQRGNYLTILNSTIAGNVATGGRDPLDDVTDAGGGAIDQFEALEPNVLIVNSTIAHNSAPYVPGRDGIWLENGKLRVRNSIIADNGNVKANGNSAANCTVETGLPVGLNPTFTAEGVNLVTDTSCGSIPQSDPKLKPLGDYGGPTLTYALQPDSPAIDAVPIDQCTLASDQRRAARPRDGNGDGFSLCDIGAFEYAMRFLVNAAESDGLAGHWTMDTSGGSLVRDGSANHLHGSLQGAAAYVGEHAPVRFDNNSSMTATGGYAEIPDAALLDPSASFALAAWVKLDTSPGSTLFLAKRDSESGPGYALTLTAGQLQAEVWNNAGTRYAVAHAVAGAGGWLHIAMRWTVNQSLTLYLNGMAVAGTPATGALQPTPAPLRMGGIGLIDEVRLYNVLLSDSQFDLLASGRSCVSGGTAWTDVVPDLQCALGEAETGNEIWVAKGRYLPTHGADRTAAFQINDGISVYGGFLGDETTRDARNPVANLTVLSGDVDENDPADGGGVVTDPQAIAGANAYHVVLVASSFTPTTLDGFTVTGGQADGAAGAPCGPACGGGIYGEGGSPVLQNLTLMGNRAGTGGAVYVSNGNLTLVNTAVRGNIAGIGGGIFVAGGTGTLVDLFAAGNRATGDGGGIYATGGTFRFVNMSLAGNRADARGGGIFVASPLLEIANSIVTGNVAAEGSQFYNGGGTLQIHRSLLTDGCPAGAGCTELQTADPQFVQPIDATSAPTGGGDLRLQPASPAIDAGDNNASLGDTIYAVTTIAELPHDVTGGPRVIAVRSATPTVDLGACEMANSPPVFTTTPVTSATATQPYVYQITAIDPNDPEGARPIIVQTLLPLWANFQQTGEGQARIIGTPNTTQIGKFAMTLRAVDALNASTEQKFFVNVSAFNGKLYLPAIKR